MYKVHFLLNSNGKSDSLEFIRSTAFKTDKQSVVLSNKINDYITALSQYGLSLGEPFIKHLEDDIWELRPKNIRFLFGVKDDSFIILTYFAKKSRKTPRYEILLAKKKWADYLAEEKGNE